MVCRTSTGATDQRRRRVHQEHRALAWGASACARGWFYLWSIFALNILKVVARHTVAYCVADHAAFMNGNPIMQVARQWYPTGDTYLQKTVITLHGMRRAHDELTTSLS